MIDVSSCFSNYPAFAYNFKPVIIEKIGKNDYIAYMENDSAENWLQRGTKEYINVWLYGAVQAACGQIQPCQRL